MVTPSPADAQPREQGLVSLETPEGARRYPLPARVLGALILAAATQRHRSFARDARTAMQGLSPLVWGMDHVPPDGPCLVTCNHYTRPGFGAWWIALGIGAAVAAQRAAGAPEDIHWVMTAAWRYPRGDWRRRVITPLTTWAFERVAHVYDFVTMPPMPPDPDETAARALAVRRTLRLARRLVNEGGLLGLAPEGQETPEVLGAPPPGAGTFIALLVAAGMPVLPVGVAEHGGRLWISFGEPFVPEIPQRRADRDSAVIDQVMAAIGAQLPSSERP